MLIFGSGFDRKLCDTNRSDSGTPSSICVQPRHPFPRTTQYVATTEKLQMQERRTTATMTSVQMIRYTTVRKGSAVRVNTVRERVRPRLPHLELGKILILIELGVARRKVKVFGERLVCLIPTSGRPECFLVSLAVLASSATLFPPFAVGCGWSVIHKFEVFNL
jgi:hypothetical protein